MLLFFNLNLLIAIPLDIAATVLGYYLVINYPVSLMNSYRLSLSEEADLVYEQFILSFQAGGTIFDAIEMVAQSGHPYLSKAFQNILKQIAEGTPPETCLMEFAKNQPSDDLRRYFVSVLSALEKKTDLLELLSGESFEADMTLRQMNLELESRLLIVAALSTYIPIMITLALALSGQATNLAITLVAPVLVSLNLILKSRFSSRFSAYFDRPREDLLLAPSQKEIITEYDEFLNFLILLSERLSSGDTLEVAVPAVREDVAPEVQRLIDPAINSIYSTGESLEVAMSKAADKAYGQRVEHLLRLIPLMCETSAKEAGERLTRIAGRLVKRSAVAKERDTIITAQRMKVYLLNVTSSAVLGLLCALSPFLYIGSLLSEGASLLQGGSILDITPLVGAMITTTTATGYLNTQMINGTRPKLFAFISALIFWISLAAASSILGLSLV